MLRKKALSKGGRRLKNDSSRPDPYLTSSLFYIIEALDLMLKNLFSSTIRIKLLNLFLTNPDKNFYIREIQRLVKKTLSAIRKELNNLESIRITKWET